MDRSARRSRAVSTNVGKRGLSPEEAKKRVYSQGLTLKEFAERTNVSYRTLSEVIRGVNKGLYGEGHRAAVALGMK